MSKVAWTSILLSHPVARKVVLKTRQGPHFIHVMTNKDGTIVPWSEQDERWTDGRFEYADVTHWAEL